MIAWLIWVVGLTISTLLGVKLVKSRRDDLGYPVLVSIFIAYILTANVLAPRIMMVDLGLVTLALAGGTIIFPFCSQVSDMINEIYGRKKTYTAITIAYLTNVLLILFILISAYFPPAPWLLEREETWRFFLLQTPRIIVASWIAFIIVSFLDAKIFADLKEFFHRKFKENPQSSTRSLICFSLARSCTSDVINMVVDSLIFFPLAFAFVMPLYALISLIVGGTIAKCMITVIDTPWFVLYRLSTRDVKREF